MGVFIECRLGLDRPVMVYNYPASQASLARINPHDPKTALRFEVFYKGKELGNGFNELADANQQRQRFDKVNRQRLELGKTSLEPDGNFLKALEAGFPDCSGIAVGFDRLVMLATNNDHIRDVVSFSWDRC
jgi:lysyl-tRNA synthetase class 2